MPGRICRKFLFVSLTLLFLPVFSSAQSGLVNINTAGVTELKTLNGIGDVKAQAIITYRNGPNGPFETIEEIKNVSGIGDVTYSNIKDFITVGAPPVPEVQAENKKSDNTSSVHYGFTPISNVDKRMDVSVSAGRDRLGTVGSPMEFVAETDFEYTKGSIFKWNFGDGTQGNGDVLTHTYQYPGEYVAVLNVSLPQGQAVARVSVKIVEPEIIIASASPERIELKNNSKFEANLYGRALWAGGKIFVFPQDTIIKAAQSISFGSRVTGLEPNGLNDVQLMVIGDTEQPKIGNKIEEERQKQMANLQNQISLLRQQMANISPPNLAVKPPSEEPVIEEAPTPQTAAAVKSGWLQTLKQFFLRTK